MDLDVSADYLTIEGERVPMAPAVAQAAVGSLDALLPTPAVVDAIEAAASVVPLPAWSPPPGQDREAQTSSAVFAWCEEQTRRMFAERGLRAGQLVAGHRKDVVLDDHMPAGMVVIYGGRWDKTGKRIQGEYAGHGDWYEDYSHGVRAVRRRCWVDGKEALLDELYQRAPLGPVARLRYPLAGSASAPHGQMAPPQAQPGGSHVAVPEARPTPTVSAVLRRGHTGPAVVELQTLLASHYPVQIDGVFGPKTEAAVLAFQRDNGLTVDGLAGPKTLTALRSAGDTDRPPAPLPDVPAALSDAEVAALFGPLCWEAAPTAAEPGAIRILNGWQQDNLRRVVIPQLCGVQGAPADGGVFLHRLVAEQTRALWAAWEKAGLLPLVLSWAGSWNPRLVRGGSTLSRHAYAVGWDINAAWNPMGKPAAPMGAKGSVVELVPLAVEHGYTNGLAWSRPDAMHFEAYRVL